MSFGFPIFSVKDQVLKLGDCYLNIPIVSVLGKAVVNELCHGWTPEAADVFHNYHILSALLETGSDPGFWLGLRVLLLTVGILSCGLELALYGILFKGFYTHDKGMIQALGLDTVTKRTRRYNSIRQVFPETHSNACLFQKCSDIVRPSLELLFLCGFHIGFCNAD